TRCCRPTSNNHVYIQTHELGHKAREALILLFCKSVLDGDVFSFNPAKLAQLLPEGPYEHRHTRSSAIVQETDAENFPHLLRMSRNAKRHEQSAKRKANDFFLHGFACVFLACTA